jgi:hypothetical protein
LSGGGGKKNRRKNSLERGGLVRSNVKTGVSVAAEGRNGIGYAG